MFVCWSASLAKQSQQANFFLSFFKFLSWVVDTQLIYWTISSWSQGLPNFHSNHPTQSILSIPLQVATFRKIDLLIARHEHDL